MPRVGREVQTPDGIGTVVDLNILKETVSVRITNGDSSEIKEFPLEEIVRSDAEKPHENMPPAGKKNRMPADADSRNGSPDGEPPTGSEADGDHENGRRDIQPEARRQGRPQDGKKGNRNPNRDGQQLGKPVRRENPNRPKEETAAADNPSPAPEKKAETTTRGSWADALQKAMDAIN